MKRDWELTEEAFNAFLDWLHPDREQAAEKYLAIRRCLIIILTSRGCDDAAALADETIDRVIRRAPEIAGSYRGDPTPYFITVARRLHLEYIAKNARRSEMPAEVPEPPAQHDDEERVIECLEHCMRRLKPDDRDLVLEYYRDEKQAKIDHRRKLAEKLGIGLNALRIRTHRIRAALEECIAECLKRSEP